MISIIDCGVGNSTSIKICLEHLGFEVKSIKNSSELSYDTDIVLCGVGSFDSAIVSLQQKGFLDILPQILIKEKQRVLGICLGMQVLTIGSQEGKLNGLGYFPVEVKKLESTADTPVPHIGWSKVKSARFNVEEEFYFAHSYAVLDDNNDAIGETFYGQKIISMLQKGKVLGVQFHPEKSYEAGKKLLSNFFSKD